MSSALSLQTYQCGTPRKVAEGLRIGTVRFLPRGVPKSDYVKRNYFDLWLPLLAPSRELLRWLKTEQRKGAGLEALWPPFRKRYEREMLNDTDCRQELFLLANIAARTPIAIGCYCENEALCHRSILAILIRRAANDALG